MNNLLQHLGYMPYSGHASDSLSIGLLVPNARYSQWCYILYINKQIAIKLYDRHTLYFYKE